MIAHVAETGEDRGRVVLHVTTGNPNVVAVEAALRVARAFGSDVESMFVEDEQLFDCASYSFVKEVSLTGRASRPLTRDTMMRDLHLAAQAARRRVETLARKAEVGLHCRVVRDEPMRALSIACAERGPWNIVALAEPFQGGHGRLLKQLLSEVSGTTALIVVGPKARQVSGTGTVVVAVENIAQLPDMLRTAERIAAVDGADILLLLIAPDEEQLDRMDGETRLVVEARENVRIQSAAIARGEAAVIAETLRRLRPGMVICRFGGLVASAESQLHPLAAALECPLFLVR
jgi:hypothetical protein